MITLSRRPDRRGATTVEFAITLPILFMIVFAAIEFSRANVLINSAKIAAAEGARKGIILGTTADDIRAVVMNELRMVGVSAADVVVEPPVVTDDTKVVTVGLRLPLDARNGYVTPKYFVGDFVHKITTIPREAKTDAEMDDLLAAAYENMEDKLGSLGNNSGNVPGNSGNNSGNSGNGNGNSGNGNGNGNGNSGNGNGNSGNGNGNSGNGNGNSGNGNGNGGGGLGGLLGWLLGL